jgi:hypothetical protein
MPITTPLHKVKGLPKIRDTKAAQAIVRSNVSFPKFNRDAEGELMFSSLKRRIELDYVATKVLPDKLAIDSFIAQLSDLYAELEALQGSPENADSLQALRSIDARTRSLEIALTSALQQRQTFTGRTVLRYRESQLRETRTELLNDMPSLLRRYSFINTGVQRLYAIQYGHDEQTRNDKELLLVLAKDVQKLLTSIERGQLETYKLLKRRIENYQYLHTARGVELSQPVVAQLDDVFQAADFLEEKRQNAVDKLNKTSASVGKFIGIKGVNLYNAFRLIRGTYRVGRSTKRVLQNVPSYLREGLSNLRDIHNLAAQALPYSVRRAGDAAGKGLGWAGRKTLQGAKAASKLAGNAASKATASILKRAAKSLRSKDSNAVGRALRKAAVLSSRKLRRSLRDTRLLAKSQEESVAQESITTQTAATPTDTGLTSDVPDTSAVGEWERKNKKPEKAEQSKRVQHAKNYKTIIEMLTVLTADVRTLQSKVGNMPAEIVQPVAQNTSTIMSRTYSALKEIQLKPLVQSIVQLLSLPSNKKAMQQRIEPSYGMTSETQQAANAVAEVEDRRMRESQTADLHVIAENARRPRDSFGTLLDMLLENPVIKGLIDGAELTAGIAGLGTLVVKVLNTEVGKQFVSWAAELASKIGTWVYDSVESYFSKKALDSVDRYLKPTTTALTESGKVTALGVNLDKLAPTTKSKFSNLLTHVQNLGFNTPDVHSISDDGYSITMPSTTINDMEKSGLLADSGFVRTSPTAIRDANVRKSYPSATRSLLERLTDYNATLDTRPIDSKAQRTASGRVTNADGTPLYPSNSSVASGLGKSSTPATQPKLVNTQAPSMQKAVPAPAAQTESKPAAQSQPAGSSQANSVLSIPTFSWMDGGFFFANLGHLAR